MARCSSCANLAASLPVVPDAVLLLLLEPLLAAAAFEFVLFVLFFALDEAIRFVNLPCLSLLSAVMICQMSKSSSSLIK